MPACRPDLPQMEAGPALCGVLSGLGNDVQTLTMNSDKGSAL
jgi:Zn-dependent alcohol dehydrogenase